MEPRQLVTLKDLAEFVEVPAHRIIHLCERGLVRPAVPAEGRGTVRRFDRDNTFRVLLALRLEDLGLQHEVIRLLTDGIDELMGTDVAKEALEHEIVTDAPALFDRLGDDENPAMGMIHLTHQRERVVEFVLPKSPDFIYWRCGSLQLSSLPQTQNVSLAVVVDLTLISKLLI